MRKAILVLISGLISGAAYAAVAPAQGTSAMILDKRQMRKLVQELDKDIAKLDQDIVDRTNLAKTLKAMPNDGLRSAQMEALAEEARLERTELVKQRAAFQSALKQ